MMIDDVVFQLLVACVTTGGPTDDEDEDEDPSEPETGDDRTNEKYCNNPDIPESSDMGGLFFSRQNIFQKSQDWALQ